MIVYENMDFIQALENMDFREHCFIGHGSMHTTFPGKVTKSAGYTTKDFLHNPTESMLNLFTGFLRVLVNIVHNG